MIHFLFDLTGQFIVHTRYTCSVTSTKLK